MKFCIRRTVVREKAKTKQLCYETVTELSTKEWGNSLSFLTNTHTTLPAKRFGNYRILTIDVTAEFRLRTEQQQNGF
jgi:hypothetical protein